jgi:hypothetical protein
VKSVVKRTILTAKARVIDAPEAVSEEICQSIAKAADQASVNQEDLLHVRSVMVTTGSNENHDVFTREELWAARNTPVHKPSDWDHNRLKIIGHIYSVEARTLTGDLLDLSAATPTTMAGEPFHGDFELVVDEVIYAYILPEYAEEIRERSKAGTLFVSMEVWFKDYDYAVWKEPVTAAESAKPTSVSTFEDGIVIIPRRDNIHMESSLRTAGGSGKTDEGKLIGRALKNMIFGGKGFVGVPANPRSSIESVGNDVEEVTPASLRMVANEATFRNVDETGDGWTHAYEVRLTEYDTGNPYLSMYGEFVGTTMQDAIDAFTAFEPLAFQYVERAMQEVGATRELKQHPTYTSVEYLGSENKIQYNLSFELSEQEQGRVSYEQLLVDIGLAKPVTASVDQEVQDLEVESMNADTVKRLETQVEELTSQITALRDENASLKTAAQNEERDKAEATRLETLDELVRTIGESDITAKLFAETDAVLQSNMDGEEQANKLWDMRMEFIRQTASTYKESAEAAETKLQAYRTAERIEKVVALDLYSEERLEKVKEQIAGMTDEAFAEWFEEKEEFVAMIAEKATKAAEETDETTEETEDKAEATTEETESETEETTDEKTEDKAEATVEETEEVKEDDAAEAALEALGSAESEDTPKFEDTDSDKGEPTQKTEEDNGLGDLVDLTTTNTSERLERLKKERKNDNFGR